MSDFKLEDKADADQDSYRFQFAGSGFAARQFFDDLILTTRRNWNKFPIAEKEQEELPDAQKTLEG